MLAAADLRAGQSLDGEWTDSIDPYRDRAAGFHGEPPGLGHRRYDDVDVAANIAHDRQALYEYDMDHLPVALLPSSWLTHQPEMRHYGGLVWYQKRFDAAPRPGERPGIQDGWNRKGLVSETGQRKLAFGVLVEWYAERAKARSRSGRNDRTFEAS